MNKKIATWLSVILIMLSFVGSRAQEEAGKGIVSGKVVDKATGEPLIGVNVLMEGTMRGAITDLEGKFRVANLPAGVYTVKITMIGYAPLRINETEILKNKTTEINVALEEETIAMNEVVIEAKAVKNTEASLLVSRQKASSVSDAVSSEAFSKAGAGNAADAMKMVTGASVAGKDVFVRGLGERYVSTQLNGAEIPSTDPYKRTGSIDLIPSNLIDNIVTTKSFTPDKQGNFSGGTVDIKTKDFPDAFQMSLSVSNSYNSQTTFNDDGPIGYDGGDYDLLGMDDGTRDLPGKVGDELLVVDAGAARKDYELAKDIENKTKSFNSQMTYKKVTPSLNNSVSFSLGNQYEVFSRSLGFLASLTYSHSVNSYDNGKYMRWKLLGQDSTKKELDNEFDFNDTKTKDEVLWGALLKTSYKISPMHAISFNMIFNQNGESQTRFLEGSYPYDISEDWLFQTHVLQYNERTLKSFQLDGDHQLRILNGARLNWQGTYSNTKQDEPDLRSFYNYKTDQGVYGIKSNLPPERYYRDMSENKSELKLDLAIPFKQWAGRNSTLKVGGLASVKDRDHNERIFTYQPVSKIGTYFRNVEGDIEKLFSEEYLGIVGIDTAGNGKQYYNLGLYVNEIDKKSGNYDGDQAISAGYTMVDMPISKKLRMITGIRFEKTDMTVESQDTTLEKGEIKTDDFLPSINFIYQLKENMNVRFAYGRTLARPTFREISTFASFDFNGGDTYIGNPDLKRTLIDNYDFRWEWFSRPGEIYAVSAFWKDFYDPIETVIIDVNYNIQWKNVDHARVMGLEFEFRKKLDILHKKLSNFMLGSNLSLVDSKVDISDEELAMIRSTRPDASSSREFQGQSPYIFNLFLNYDNYQKGISGSLYYNVFGERLSTVSLAGTPDVYEQPAAMLNMSLSWKFLPNWSIKLSGKNLLNSEEKKLHEYKGKEFIYSKYQRGLSFSFAVKYSI